MPNDITNTKTFEMPTLTEQQRQEYEALRLTEDESRTANAETTTD